MCSTLLHTAFIDDNDLQRGTYIDAEEHGTTSSANRDCLYTKVVLTHHKVESYTGWKSEEGKGNSQWTRASVLQVYTQPSSS